MGKKLIACESKALDALFSQQHWRQKKGGKRTTIWCQKRVVRPLQQSLFHAFNEDFASFAKSFCFGTTHTQYCHLQAHFSKQSKYTVMFLSLSRKWWFCLSLKRYLACLSFYGFFKRDLQLLEKTAFFSFRAAAVVSWLLWLLESPLKLKISSVQQKPLKTRLHCFLGREMRRCFPTGFFSIGNKVLDAWLHQQFVPFLSFSWIGKTQLKRKLHFNSIFLLLSFSEFETNLAV